MTRSPRVLVAALGFALLLLSPALAVAQEPASELDQIVAKHLEARGGLEAIQAIQSLRVTGSTNAQGMDLPMTLLSARPNRFRMEMDMQGMKMVTAFDGEQAWGANPMTGQAKPAALEGPQATAIEAQADMDGPFVDTAQKGVQLELVGKEPWGEGEVYHIKVTNKAGTTESAFIDAESFLQVRALTKGDLGMGEMEIEVTFDEWVEVAGVKMPKQQTMNTPMGAMVTTFADYQVNEAIDEDLFFLPGQKADPALDLTQILEKHRAARVSAAAGAIESVKAQGNLVLMGFELPLEMSFLKSGACRLEADMAGTPMTLAYDGADTAWTVSPMQGIMEPEALEPEGVEAIALFSEFLWGLLGDEAAASAQLAGIEKVNRSETYKIVLDQGTPQERTIFLGGEDFLEHKLALRTVFLGSETDIVALMSDYSTTDGLAVPGMIELQSGGTPAATVLIKGVETNVEIDPSIFALPEPAPAGE